jgi:transposase
MNVVSEYKQKSIEELVAKGVGLRDIARRLLVDRSTVRRVARKLSKPPTPSTGSEDENGVKPPTPSTGTAEENVPPRRPASASEPIILAIPASECAPHRDWIEAQVDLGRNAMSIYQDMVEMHGFGHKYSSVQRFVKKLKRRNPERFDFLEYGPGEEAQVDYGEGAPTLLANGKYKKPYLFVMTLKYSGKSFRKVVWKTSQEVWAKLHEEAFRAFGGCTRYVVLDNLKEGVIKPDTYEPELNKVYEAVLAHYGVVAQPCRVRDPNRKGSVERAIQHTQDTALKGKTFETIEKQNEWLAHWEERWAAPRIHGRKKRQVQAMYLEEKPHLLPLPAAGFRSFVEEERKVDDSGTVQIKGSYYSVPTELIYLPVRVRIYADEIAILDLKGDVVRRHPRTHVKGRAVFADGDRLFNPSRETAGLFEKIGKIGPNADQFAQDLFARDGRIAHNILWGLVGLAKTYTENDIDRVCGRVLTQTYPSYRSIKTILKSTARPRTAPVINLQQQAPEIRPASDYQRFWELHARSNNQQGEETNGNVSHGTREIS